MLKKVSMSLVKGVHHIQEKKLRTFLCEITSIKGEQSVGVLPLGQ